MLKLPKVSELKPRERLLAVGAGMVMAVLVMDLAVLSPWLAHQRQIRKDTQQMEQALAHDSRLLARREYIMTQLRVYQRYLRPPVADELQMAVLLKEIEGLAEQSHIRLGEIKPLAAEANALIKRYSLDVQFECTLEEWVDFVTQLEASSSLYQIARAALASQENTPDRLKASLRVVSSVLQVGPASRAPDLAGGPLSGFRPTGGLPVGLHEAHAEPQAAVRASHDDVQG